MYFITISFKSVCKYIYFNKTRWFTSRGVCILFGFNLSGMVNSVRFSTWNQLWLSSTGLFLYCFVQCAFAFARPASRVKFLTELEISWNSVTKTVNVEFLTISLYSMVLFDCDLTLISDCIFEIFVKFHWDDVRTTFYFISCKQIPSHHYGYAN